MTTIADFVKGMEQDEGWTPPVDVLDLLKRGLKRARDEANWLRGDWVGIKDVSACPLTPGGRIDYTKFTCANVRACAMGILVIESGNGALIRAYFSGEKDVSWSRLATFDPLVQDAAKYLAAGIQAAIGGGTVDERLVYVGDAQADVIEANDDEDNTHDQIVRGFELAVEHVEGMEVSRMEGFRC